MRFVCPARFSVSARTHTITRNVDRSEWEKKKEGKKPKTNVLNVKYHFGKCFGEIEVTQRRQIISLMLVVRWRNACNVYKSCEVNRIDITVWIIVPICGERKAKERRNGEQSRVLLLVFWEDFIDLVQLFHASFCMQFHVKHDFRSNNYRKKGTQKRIKKILKWIFGSLIRPPRL